MKKLLVLLFSASSLFATPEFVILVTSFNNEKYAERNLDSIVNQRSTKPYQIICVDDGSSDRTGEIMDTYAERHGYDKSFLTVIHNKKQVGSALENIYNTVHNHIADDKVVVCIDGDDTLSFSGVLKRLEQEYENPAIWMTYGRFVVIPKGQFWTACWGYPEEVIQERSFRKHPNVPSHLKTFKAKLFMQIRKEDLIDNDGRFYRKAWDMAMLFPMLEMCAPYEGENHSSFIADTVMYVYNFENPIGDCVTGRDKQVQLDSSIRRAKQPYEPLEDL